MAIELGAEPSVAAKDASTVVDMEIALVKVSGLLLFSYGKCVNILYAFMKGA